jgi:hypothetical protein
MYSPDSRTAQLYLLPNPSVCYRESANPTPVLSTSILSTAAAAPLVAALRSVRVLLNGILEKPTVSLESEGIGEGGEEEAVPTGECRGGWSGGNRRRTLAASHAEIKSSYLGG